MMEKRQPTYDLEAFKAAFSRVERLAVTGTALRSAAALGFGRIEIVATIQAMKREHFYKSMTAYSDHRLWQDVYHVPSSVGGLYVKFTPRF
jgi:motility quorum-sensing regulator/GCU-specific mRNA interferase toxin